MTPAQCMEQRLLWVELWRKREHVEWGTGKVSGVLCSGRFAFASPVAVRSLAVLSPALKMHRSGKE